MARQQYVIVFFAIAAATWCVSAAQVEDQSISFVVSNLSNLHRVTTEPHKMEDSTAGLCRVVHNDNLHEANHATAYCHVYVNAAAQGPMADGKTQYPTGAVIVKSKLRDKTSHEAELFTVMRKMPAGYDTEHGDWEYSVLDGKSARILAKGRIDSCITCHRNYPSSDYVTRAYLSTK